jgi:hypothetical protein
LTTLDFNDLTPGQYIHDELWDTKGVKITAIKSGRKGFTPINGVHNAAGGGAMIFDASKPTGDMGQTLCSGNDGDDDLGSPNVACPGGGPGDGPGGAPTLSDGSPNPYNNCDPIGNVLVIQESDKSCPDDSWSGGWIQFDFKNPASVQLAKLLDVDEGNTPEINISHGDGYQTMLKTTATGDNGVWSQPILLNEVTRIKIKYYGSGSIAGLVYSICL